MGYKKVKGTRWKVHPALGKYVGRYNRIDHRATGEGLTPGWLMWPVVNGKRHHVFFPDSIYGGNPDKSLEACIARRDEVLTERLPTPARAAGGRNKSGRNGVSFIETRYKMGRGGQKVVKQSECWAASWTDYSGEKKKTVCRRFSVKRYGYFHAYAHAVAVRWAWENKELEKSGQEPDAPIGITPAPWMKEKGIGVEELISFVRVVSRGL